MLDQFERRSCGGLPQLPCGLHGVCIGAPPPSTIPGAREAAESSVDCETSSYPPRGRETTRSGGEIAAARVERRGGKLLPKGMQGPLTVLREDMLDDRNLVVVVEGDVDVILADQID